MSHIDGRKVQYQDKPDWTGIVIGDSHTEGYVRVNWDEPHRQISIHHVDRLKVLDAPASQEELFRKYHGLDDNGKPIPFTTEG